MYSGKKGTKYENSLGGIYITYHNDNIGEIVIKIGSGFTDEERQLYWENPEEIINKIGEYQYFGETANQKNDDTDLRFATWKCLRLDKGENDLNYE